MKKLILAMTLSLVGTMAFAQADRERTVLKCGFERGNRSVSRSLEMVEGGFTGLTQIRITQDFHRGGMRPHVENYIVREQARNDHRMGGSAVYIGNGIMFSINWTTAPGRDGLRTAYLRTRSGGDEVLACRGRR